MATPSQALLRWFSVKHLPEGEAKRVSNNCAYLATWIEAAVPDGPEKTAGLRKLLEAKDCFVRAALPMEIESERLPHADVPGMTPETCPERESHGKLFRYCPVKGCGWYEKQS